MLYECNVNNIGMSACITTACFHIHEILQIPINNRTHISVCLQFKHRITIYETSLVAQTNHVFSLSDLEEGQLSECGGEEELGGRESPLPRSSSTSDITQQLSDTLPGILKTKSGCFTHLPSNLTSNTPSESCQDTT